MCVSYYGSGGWGLGAGGCRTRGWGLGARGWGLRLDAWRARGAGGRGTRVRECPLLSRARSEPQPRAPVPTEAAVFDAGGLALVCSAGDARIDDGLPADDSGHRAPGGSAVRTQANRVEAGRSQPGSAHLRRHPRAIDAPLRRAVRSGRAPRRPGRDAGVVRTSAPRGLSGDSVDGRRAPHAQPAAASRRSDPYRERRRRPRRDRRREPAAAVREGQAARVDRACHRHVGQRRREDAGRRARAARLRSARSRRPTRRASSSRSSTSRTRPRCATRRARPAVRRACSTRIAPSCCIRWRRASAAAWG